MKRKFLATMGVAAVLALVASVASADMVLTLDDTSTVAVGGMWTPNGLIDIVVVDGKGIGFITASGLVTTDADINPLPGMITYLGPAGAGSVFLANVATGSSKPLLGPPPEIDLNSVDISGSGAGTVIIGLTDTGFVPTTAGPWGLESQFGGTAHGTISSSWFADEFNGEFVAGTAGSTFGPFAGAFSDSGVSPLSIPASGAISLSTLVTITHTGAGLTSFDSKVRIPAPGSALLGVIGLALLRRRRS